jgi:RNA polymerase primary sigma factor
MSNHMELLEEPKVKQLLAEGARDGHVAIDRINDLLGDLDIDEFDAESLFEALENRAIEIVDDAEARKAEARENAVRNGDLSSLIAAPSQERAGDQASGTPNQGNVAQGIPTKGIPKPVTPPQAAKSAKSKKAGEHSDLDEVLSSLDDLLNSPLGELMARDDARTEGTQVEEEETGTDLGAPVEDSYAQYLHRMSAVPLLDEDEERRLARIGRDGDGYSATEARQKLMEANWRLVVSLSRHYQGRASLPLLDIVQEGNIGLMRAIERWNPDRKERLASYASWYIRQSINRAIQAQVRSIRLPGHLAAAIQKLQRLQRELAQELKREPSVDELAQAAEMTPSQVGEALRTFAEPISLETPLGDDDTSRLGDFIADTESDSPLRDITRDDVRTSLIKILSVLSDKERAVIEQRFALGDYETTGVATLDDVARRMNLSRDRVRDLETRALRKMRSQTRGTALDGLFDTDFDLD